MTPRFPEPARVIADYSDEVERYAALFTLWVELPKKTPITSDPAYERTDQYARAFGVISGTYLRLPADEPAKRAFDERGGKLVSDATFRARVLEKYGLTGLPDVRVPGAGLKPAISGNPIAVPARKPPKDEAEETFRQLLEALSFGVPFWIVTLIAVAAAPVLFALFLDGRARTSSAPEARRDDPLQLPEALRIIRVPGRRYDVEIQSGQVLEEKTWAETHVTATATGGGAFVTGGPGLHSPVQLEVRSTNVQNDRIWIRTVQGTEADWNLTGGGFSTRQGQIISRVGRRLRNGLFEFLLAYNHSTGQLQAFDGINDAHLTRKLFPWLATTLLGAAGFVLGTVVVAVEVAGTGAAMLMSPSTWAIGLTGSAMIALIVVFVTGWLVRRLRNWRFNSGYVPRLRSFFEQCTPELRKRFSPGG